MLVHLVDHPFIDVPLVDVLIELGAGFHPEISGRENVFINGIMLGLTRREIAWVG